MKIGRIAAALCIAFLVLAASCTYFDDETAYGGATPTPENSSPDSSPKAASYGQTGEVVLTGGFGLSWARMNHRISLWEAYPIQATDLAGARIQAGYVGGSYTTGQRMTDSPLIFFRGSKVQMKETKVIFGTTTLRLTADELFEKRVEIKTEQLPINGNSPCAVLVQGVSILTDVPQTDPEYPENYDPALGYTLKSFAVQTGEPSIQKGQASFELYARFKPGPADRILMNRAIRHATVELTVHYALIVFNPKSGADVHRFEHGYELTYPPPFPLIPQNIPRATPEQRQIKVEIGAGPAIAIVGLSGFEFNLFEDPDKGDYIRELSVDAKLIEYTSSTGSLKIDIDGYASNSSLIAFETMKTEFKAAIVVARPSAGAYIPFELHEAFDTGRTTFPVR